VKEKEMPDLKVGDEVRVFDTNGRRSGQPEGGWLGTVIKIGRKYVTIDYGRKAESFEFGGRRANDPYGHRHFKTLDQVTLDDRRQRAKAVLSDHKIRLDMGHQLALDQIEALADFVRKL
jgi:hypothetical protein